MISVVVKIKEKSQTSIVSRQSPFTDKRYGKVITCAVPYLQCQYAGHNFRHDNYVSAPVFDMSCLLNMLLEHVAIVCKHPQTKLHDVQGI